ncbi:hypothetical protein [Brevibacillus sp. NRS-1366]|uniref:hypothetical protein n=1 Tax=Brevibacillus sp. NRS-1366 TaxID=3233899 RepID=UPI003D1EC333
MTTKLILVEGTWGAGKTTTATFIQNTLEQRKIKSRLYTEGCLDHPVDPDHVSCFSHAGYDEILESYPDESEQIRKMTYRIGSYFLIPFLKMKRKNEHVIPEELWARLQSSDIYNGDLSQYLHCKVVLELWDHFATVQHEKDEVIVLECCFLQNPVVTLMARYGPEKHQIFQHIQNISQTIRKLNPIVIYLQHESTEATFERAIHERSKEWIEGVSKYCMERGYAKKHGLKGVPGLVQFLEEREKIELEILRHLGFTVKHVNIYDDNKEQFQNEMMAYLDSHVF